MKLTGRQKVFLSKFLDLYGEAEGPLHYTTVAERLGVSKITAYDMLRILEEKGLVASEYVLPVKGHGPGRSTIVFHPTQKAAEVMAQLAGEDWDREEWEAVKERILQALREGKGTDYEDLLNEILLRIPERQSPMLYSAEVITATILSLYQLKEDAMASRLFEHLRGLPGELGLNALAGLTLGLSLVERANRRFTTMLLSYTHRYQDSLSKLSTERKRMLSDFAQEVMKAIGI
ncbi:MAG: hypothetical protein J7M16_05825 [Anaerolineae bacterium]|nr:hypothetical protein [Anaerolineae bacterium]